jgi:hypothetical protein
MPRSFFDVMAKEAHIADWREAFTYGQAKAKGVDQILKVRPTVAELALRGQYGLPANSSRSFRRRTCSCTAIRPATPMGSSR